MTSPSGEGARGPAGSPAPAGDVQATFVATLVDEWVRCGLRHAVICPGSRSTPLALAFADRDEVTLHVHHDERSGGFLALGLARSGMPPVAPAAVVTTSGTAAVELHPAVVEAHHAGVPMLVCTADRPPELQDVGAPQTIDQTHLYGRAVRWFADPGIAGDASTASWRGLASRAVAEATGEPPGPVHLNLPFREPLVGTPGPLPEARPGGQGLSRPERQPWTVARHATSLGPHAGADLVGRLAGRRGLVLAGEGSGRDTLALAAALGWPVAADPRSPAWTASPVNVPCLDGILRSGTARSSLQPEVVLRLGEPPASRVVNDAVSAWCASGDTEEIVVSATRWSDPAATATIVVRADPVVVARELLPAMQARTTRDDPVVAGDGDWSGAWRAAADSASRALCDALDGLEAPNEPAVARDLVAAMPPDTYLVVSSSMPIRDVERYAEPREDVGVVANRGANGIDGVVSTAVGVALGSGQPTGLLVGDVAFLHDSNGLIGAAERGIDLVVVVVDNDGGGIFSFLPQARLLAEERFEQLFGTPHGLDLAQLAEAYGVVGRELRGDAGDLAKHVEGAFGRGGVHVLVVKTDRAGNVDVHQVLDHAIATAVDRAG